MDKFVQNHWTIFNLTGLNDGGKEGTVPYQPATLLWITVLWADLIFGSTSFWLKLPKGQSHGARLKERGGGGGFGDVTLVLIA